MDWIQLEAGWGKFDGSARANWGSLTDSDLESVTGKRSELVSVVQNRYRLTDAEARRQVDNWAMGLLDITEPVKRH